MSGVVKAAKKVFKPVIKYAPIALGAAALVFTAGAALGVPGTAGGWGGAVSKLTQSLGAGDMLTNTLSGALTQAGYGAVLGGATSMLTGGDPLKGAGFGAAGGAVTGGLMGAAGMKTDPLGGIGENPASETAMGVTRTDLPGPPAGLDESAMASAAAEGRPFAGYSAGYGSEITGSGGAAALPGSATPAGSGGGGLFDPGGWVERNQGLVGYGVQGLGQGLMSMAQGDDAGRAGELALERDDRERRYIRENYGSGDVPGYRKVAETSGNPPPATRFDPASYQFDWVYDPAQGKIVKQPRQ
jgi:hypothetical protein